MAKAVKPIRQMGSRLPQAGRIRIGVRTKNAMAAIDTFRFTSKNRDVIELLAEIYGGTVQVWQPAANRSEWEVITTSSVINVVVPPGALGQSPVYEFWTKGGLQRRCDGETMQTSEPSPDGAIQVEQPCLCEIQGRLLCRPTTRLNVLLPDIPFTGVWMLETKSEYAAVEMPGMVDMITKIQAAGFAKAELAIEHETQVKNGQTRHFNVPRLRVPHTLLELADGLARLSSLGKAPDHGLGMGPVAAIASPDLDDETIEAEIVEEDAPTSTTAITPRVAEMLRTADRQMHLSTDEIGGFCFAVSNGRTSNYRDLEESEIERIITVFQRINDGELVYCGLEGRRASVKNPKKIPDAE